MFPGLADWIKMLLAFAVSLLVAYVMTPPVKRFAEKVGAIDVPRDNRRVHDHPIPRMGGLAIFIGFVLSLIFFVPMSTKVLGLLVGSVIIAVMGGVDDIVSLNPWVKLAGQIVAALVAIRCGLVFDVISNPNIFAEETYIEIGWLSIPLTMLWIVGCTNAVNLIDGLDGLAVGVSAISSMTMLIVSLFVSEPVVSIILAALTGACLGFMPYNLNPAKIFMGDVGSQLLGFVLSTASIMGLFKLHAIITFFVPLLRWRCRWPIRSLLSSAGYCMGRARSRLTRGTSTTGCLQWGSTRSRSLRCCTVSRRCWDCWPCSWPGTAWR